MTIDPTEFERYSPPIPVRHRRKVPFSPRISLPVGVEEQLRSIASLDHAVGQYVVSPAEFGERVQEVVASNLYSSVRLEGSPISLEEVRSVARASFKGNSPLEGPAPSREIVNHLFLWLLPDELVPPWSVATLTRVHRALLTDVDPKARPGQLRDHPGAIYSDRGEELFITCPPEKIREELDSLLQWLNTDAAALSPLVAGAIFFHEFESIHPFTEGNGRTGRVLFHAYLQNHGLENAYRARIEVELLRHPEAYYRVLSWTDASSDYSVLLSYFAEAVRTAYQEAGDWFRAHDVGSTLDPLAHRLLVRAFTERAWFDLASARAWVPSRGEQTIRNHLNRLVGLSLLEAKGRTRSRRYRFVDPMADLRRPLEPLRKSFDLERSGSRASRRRRPGPSALRSTEGSRA
jgi:Fic family protein